MAFAPTSVTPHPCARHAHLPQELWDSPFYLVLGGVVSVLDESGAVLCIRKEGSFFSQNAGKGIFEPGKAATEETRVICTTPASVLYVSSDFRLEEFLEVRSLQL